MTATLERSSEELVHDLLGCLVVDEASWHNQNISVVVLTNQLRDLRCPYQSSAYTLVLVECHGHALAATADGDTGIDLTIGDGLSECVSELGIVSADVAVCTIVLIGHIVTLKILDHEFL